MNAQMQQFIAGLPPEKQQQLMAGLQQGGGGMPPAPGMAPPPGQMPPQAPQQDPKMGLPGQNAPNPDAFRDYQGQGAIIGDQQAQAEALRNAATPKGIQTGSGYVASNPLSHIAMGVKQYQGREAAKEALEEKKNLSAMKTKTLQDVAADAGKKKELAQALRKKSAMEEMADNQGSQGFA